jgi:hypothetical protein
MLRMNCHTMTHVVIVIKKFYNKCISEIQMVFNNKKITSTFLSGKLSATLVIPIDIARRHGLNQPSEVLVEETEEGILIRKIDVDKV